MPEVTNAAITLTAYDWVPNFARGQVRDLRARWALEELGVDYSVRYLAQGDQKSDRHRTQQPFGQVPTYEEGNLTLFESGAMLLHIADNYPGLYPDEPHGRAMATQWLIAALNSVEPAILDYVHSTVFERKQAWAQERLPLILERMTERLGALSDALGEMAWLAGSFSVADIMMVTVLRPVSQTVEFQAFDNLAAYVARGEARPAFQAALAAQLDGFTGEPPARS